MAKLPKNSWIGRHIIINTIGDVQELLVDLQGSLEEQYRYEGDERRRESSRHFWAILGAKTVVAGNQWTYVWTEVIKTGVAYGTWTTKPNGRSGSLARNMAEDPASTGTGAPSGLLVRMHSERTTTGAWEYWFEFHGGL